MIKTITKIVLTLLIAHSATADSSSSFPLRELGTGLGEVESAVLDFDIKTRQTCCSTRSVVTNINIEGLNLGLTWNPYSSTPWQPVEDMAIEICKAADLGEYSHYQTSIPYQAYELEDDFEIVAFDHNKEFSIVNMDQFSEYFLLQRVVFLDSVFCHKK
ncbi:hypothetical protein A9Q84_15400 [Halobacteriovorax marinus]|uniref:Uncharacterized protein n=1 Tax=Halobacteriovorax marinus TaxID=97084 RepID=A0A1Y5F3T0_9BACT|nr:hypothetical protein A9Q84_15400 [Halobacteriovorax marinus]